MIAHAFYELSAIYGGDGVRRSYYFSGYGLLLRFVAQYGVQLCEKRAYELSCDDVTHSLVTKEICLDGDTFRYKGSNRV